MSIFKKGRSSYNFQLNNDVSKTNQLIQDYIKANGYALIEEKGETYYRAGDAMVQGYRYFNYNISNNNLIIYAWLKAVGFGEIKIEQDGIASINIVTMNYRNSLNMLFQEIEKLNNNNNNGGIMNNSNKISSYDPNTGQPIYENQNTMKYNPNTGQPINQNVENNSYSNYNNNQFTQTFQNETTKKQEKLCEIGFWLSIFGVFCSLIGKPVGIIIYIMDFYFASQGLKTRKRGKAIATIVLSIISILIIIFELAMLA